MIEIETVYCDAMIFAGSRIDPPEYCDNAATRADDDGVWCGQHQAMPDVDGPDPDDGPDEPAWWDVAEPQHYNEY